MISHIKDGQCQHFSDGSGRCPRAALWQVFVGNGDRSYFACGIHLTKVSQAKHDDCAASVVGGCMNLKRINPGSE